MTYLSVQINMKPVKYDIFSFLNRSMPYNAFKKRHGREKVLARYDQVIISLLVFIHVNRVYTFRRFPVSCFNLFCYRYGIPSSTFDY